MILKLMIRACGKMLVLDEMLRQLKAGGHSNYSVNCTFALFLAEFLNIIGLVFCVFVC